MRANDLHRHQELRGVAGCTRVDTDLVPAMVTLGAATLIAGGGRRATQWRQGLPRAKRSENHNLHTTRSVSSAAVMSSSS